MDSTNVVIEPIVTGHAIFAAFLGIVAAAFVGIISSYLTYRFTRKIRLEAEWRIDKLKHYQDILAALSKMVNWRSEEDFDESMKDYAHASNTISLVAPQSLICALNELTEALKSMNTDKSSNADRKAKESIRRLVLAVRKDLNIYPNDDESTFKYELLSGHSTGTKR
ncbi:MAG: hypothetical protein CVT49_13655 [candidate division Zixibacteria bacterium HGW-Zixibacteria-1]|nr:MAG: hypothetical protein CVT49_13655 [candidate division Zixibacteria bacterium HGW-Zixibacteria-1]